MAEFPYTPSPSNVTRFFNKIRTVAIPSKVTYNYLKSIGFKSGNDHSLIRVLKTLGFLDASSTPTEIWKNYRSEKKAGLVMAQAIKKAYSGLFETYEDANKRSDEALRDYFKANTEVGDPVVALMLRSFKILCALADFGVVPAEAPVSEPIVTPPSKEEVTPKVKIAPSLQLNIEIHIAADTSDDKIETIFKNMKKYLLTSE